MITETYKLMCINNPDLQELWKPKYGDRVLTRGSPDEMVYLDLEDKDYIDPNNIKKFFYFCPYQEDLQLLLPTWSGFSLRFWSTSCKLRYTKIPEEGIDFEGNYNEMWIQVFMFLEFNKKWDAKEKEWLNG